MIKFENKENGRYYYLEITEDLLNDLTLVIHRGGNNYHTRQRRIFNDKNCVLAEVQRISKVRLQRGYQLIS